MKNTVDKSLVVLCEFGHIDTVLAHFGTEALKDGNGPIVVPLDYEVELGLRAKGIPFHSMTEYAAQSSLKERGLFVARMMRQLYTDPDFSFFTHKDIPLGRILGYSLGEYLLRVLYHLDVFGFILDRFKGVGTVYVPEPLSELPSTVGQLAKFEARVQVDTIAFLAHRHHLAFQIIPRPPVVMARGQVRNFVRACKRRAAIGLVQFLNCGVSLLRSRKAMRVFVSDYWWHIDSFITRLKGIEITMMERREIQNAKNFIWRHKILFNHPSDYSTRAIKRHAQERRRHYEQAWRELGDHPSFSEQCVWQGVPFWSLVQPAYDHLVTSFSEKVVETIEATERLFEKQNIRAVILRASVSGQIHFATLGLVARMMGIPAIELQHGLECSDAYSISVHKNANILASYGPLIKKELAQANGTELQVLNIGSPRFDQYRNEHITGDKKKALLEKMHMDPRRPILLYIATDIVHGQTYDTYSMRRLFQSIAHATACIEGLQVIIKIRPGPATERFFKEVFKETLGESCYLAQYEDMHELISVASVVASSYSTVTLEAMIAQKPLVLVGIDRNDLLLMESHFLPYEKAQALRIARNEDELTAYVRAIVTSTEEAEALAHNASDFLKNNFCFDGKSGERMAAFLESLRKIAAIDQRGLSRYHDLHDSERPCS